MIAPPSRGTGEILEMPVRRELRMPSCACVVFLTSHERSSITVDQLSGRVLRCQAAGRQREVRLRMVIPMRPVHYLRQLSDRSSDLSVVLILLLFTVGLDVSVASVLDMQHGIVLDLNAVAASVL